MRNKIYKIVFFLFNIFGILNLKLYGKKFKFSKILYYKTLIIFIVLIFKNFTDQYSIFYYKYHNASISLFSKTYLSANEKSQIYIITIMAWIHIHRQKEIAKILTIFFILKKFCDQNKIKINLLKLKFKLKIFFVIISLLIISNFINLIFNESGSNWPEKINTLIISCVFIYFFSLFSFIYFILIHCVFLLKNVKKILKNKFDNTHNDCQDLLNNLILIQNMFDEIRKAFKETIFLFAIFQLIIISKIVSIVLKFKLIVINYYISLKD